MKSKKREIFYYCSTKERERENKTKHDVDSKVRIGDILDASKRSVRQKKNRHDPQAEKSDGQLCYMC